MEDKLDVIDDYDQEEREISDEEFAELYIKSK